MRDSLTRRSGIFRDSFYHFGKFILLCFFKVMVPFEVRGKENIPREGKFIVASNHVSYLDPLMVGVACPRPLNYIARDTLFHYRLFGWLLKRVHVIPLKRHAADVSSVKEALKRLARGEGLLLFPEGTRSVDGSFGRGFEGVGFLARKSSAAVIPVYVQGTDRALPKGEKRIRRTRVKVFFGKPMEAAPGQAMNDGERTESIMAAIAQLKKDARGLCL